MLIAETQLAAVGWRRLSIGRFYKKNAQFFEALSKRLKRGKRIVIVSKTMEKGPVPEFWYVETVLIKVFFWGRF